VTEEAQFQVKKDLIRKRLLKYTRKAFRMLPKLGEPRILDVGCGSGIPTMELAGLSNGQIIGLDVNQPSLDRLTRKIEKAGLSDRVKVMKYSMVDMDFPDESFDIIWAEGSIHVVTFKRGLQEWKRFLKSNGFIVVHDERGDITEKLEQISICGYELLGHFILNEDIWWTEYFAPLEKLICEIRTEHPDNPKVLEILHNDQREIEMFKKNPKLNSSVFLIMKKT
jgi:ubiquinone/menaquinone biosynthesis C-methylase UbiE